MERGAVRWVAVAVGVAAIAASGFGAALMRAPAAVGAAGSLASTIAAVTSSLPGTTSVPVPPVTTTVPTLPTTTTLPKLPTTTTVPKLPTTTTVPKLPTTTTVPKLPTTTTVPGLPTTTTPAAVPGAKPPTAPSLPATTLPLSSASGAQPAGAGSERGGSGSVAGATRPLASAGGPARAGATQARPGERVKLEPETVQALRSALRRSPGKPRADAVQMALVRAGITAEQVRLAAATSPGLAAFYEGLREALAGVGEAGRPLGEGSFWPATNGARDGVFSPTAARAFAAGLIAIAVVLAVALAPRLAVAGYASSERMRRQMVREALVVGIGVVAVCVFLAVLLLRASL